MTKSFSKVLYRDYWSNCLAYSPAYISLQSVFQIAYLPENCLVKPSIVWYK